MGLWFTARDSPARDAIVSRAGGREEHHEVVRTGLHLRVPREVGVAHCNDGTSGHDNLHLLLLRGRFLSNPGHKRACPVWTTFRPRYGTVRCDAVRCGA